MKHLRLSRNTNVTRILSPLFTSMAVLLASSDPSAAQPQLTLKIASSMPMSGNALGETQTIANAIQQAIDERNSLVCEGRVQIEYDVYDDNTLAVESWDPDQVIKNAETIVADPDVVALIGHYNSGATATSLAIYNEANLAVVSPANTYPGLTKPGKGEADEPAKFYPTGRNNYARVVPADDLQGAVAARWAQSLGAETAYVLDDGDTYGRGIASVFESSAKLLGLEILGREMVDRQASDYETLMLKIKDLEPDLIYFGGQAEHGAGLLARDLKKVGATHTKFMGADAIVVQLFLEQGILGAEGAYATFGGLPPSEYTGTAKIWYDSYRELFKSEPQPYAIYGYEAASVVLDAIDQVCENNRDKIREAILATKNYEDGALDPWSFDENGDTSLTLFSGFQVQNGEWIFVESLE